MAAAATATRGSTKRASTSSNRGGSNNRASTRSKAEAGGAGGNDGKPQYNRMASLTVPDTTMEKRGSFCDRERLLGLEKKFYTVSTDEGVVSITRYRQCPF